MKEPILVLTRYKDTLGEVKVFEDERGPYITVKTPDGQVGWVSAILHNGKLDFRSCTQV